MKGIFSRSSEDRKWMILVAISLLIRLINLGHRAMSHDESLHAMYSWYLSNGLNYEHNPMMHGPLLFHLNALIYALLPTNDFTSLLFPALWGTACVGILYLYRRWLGNSGAFCAALLVSLEPGLLFYSRYLRNDIMVAFFTLLMVWAILDYRETRKGRSLVWLGVGLGLQFVTKETSYIVGAVMGSACGLFALTESRGRCLRTWLKALFAHPLMHCACLMLLLALPFASALLFPLLGWDPLDNRSALGQQRILGIAAILYLISISTGAFYFFKQQRLPAFGTAVGIFWALQIFLYTTLLQNPRHGMSSGIAGGLGYWLSQHEVQRGNQDPFFYLCLLLLYVPLLLIGFFLSTRNLRRWPMPFLWWWTLSSLLIYSWAGERMPWLVLHITLPLCLITGTQLPALFAAPGRKVLKTLVALACFQFVCNSLRVNGPLSEGPQEPLMYAHSGPDIKTSLLLIENYLDQYPESQIMVDNAFAWPMAWYFRDHNEAYMENMAPEHLQENTRIILARPDAEASFQAQGWVSRLRVDMTTWPRPHYFSFSLENIDNVLRHSATRKKLFSYYFFRQQPEWGESEWPGPSRYVLMTK